VDLLLNKLERLTPEQRREVEDYVDFLLFRSDNRPDPDRPVAPVPPVLMDAPHSLEPAPLMVPPLQPVPATPYHEDTPAPAAPAPDTVYEIHGGEDWLTRDYMDLGRFDPAPSPATEAVKKVKRKLVRREEQEKKESHLLDWVD